MGNFLIGAIRDATGSFALAMLPLVALCVIGIVAILIVARQPGSSAVAQST
ncbi:MAG: hypothetical protein JO110_23825 [Acetobacteraceae bacterium]|nr:hypothetical protein [Acetobacteraceae bacterium]